MVAKLSSILGLILVLWGLVSFGTRISFDESKEYSSTSSILLDDSTDESVRSVLKEKCMDCHSFETNLPWYGYIFPVNLYLEDHIRSGQEDLNLSLWLEFTDKRRATLAYNIIEELEADTMPPSSYLLLHPNAKITSTERDILEKWYLTLEKIYEKNTER